MVDRNSQGEVVVGQLRRWVSFLSAFRARNSGKLEGESVSDWTHVLCSPRLSRQQLHALLALLAALDRRRLLIDLVRPGAGERALSVPDGKVDLLTGVGERGV